jgi:hypothetical protein
MSARVPEQNSLLGVRGYAFKDTPLRAVRGTFIRFLQGLFSAAPAGSYHWSDDDACSELYITDGEQVDPEIVAKVPSICLTRSPVQFQSMGIGDLQAYNFATGKTSKGTLIPGTIVINCCCGNDLESEQIAWVVAEHIWLLRDILMKNGFYNISNEPVIGAPSPAGSIVAQDRGKEFFCTTVSIGYQFPRQASFTPLNKAIADSIAAQFTIAAPAVPDGYVVRRDYQLPEPFAPNAADVALPNLPLVPHPLNPSVNVVARTIRRGGR